MAQGQGEEHMNRIEEDDDIQDYKKPWKKLTEEERASFEATLPKTQEEWDELFNAIEAKLKEKNT
jgi:NTP pyrophosphatase (non-canonical NTP hydrolase)